MRDLQGFIRTTGLPFGFSVLELYQNLLNLFLKVVASIWKCGK